MERLIPINIVGAEVTTIGIVFNEETKLPDFSVTVSLIDGQNKRLTSITVDSRSYFGVQGACEKSIEFMELASKIKKELDTLVTRHLNKQQKILEAK